MTHRHRPTPPREILEPLPADQADLVDLDRLHDFVERALMAQPPHIRNRLLEHASDHELDVRPVDPDGFICVEIQGATVLRLHWTRLRPDAPQP